MPFDNVLIQFCPSPRQATASQGCLCSGPAEEGRQGVSCSVGGAAGPPPSSAEAGASYCQGRQSHKHAEQPL